MADNLDSAVWALRSTEETLSVRKPNGQMRLVVTGSLPTDRSSARTPTNVNIALLDGDGILFEAAAAMSIQGQSSAADPKPNYKFKLSNRYSGNALSVSIGGWLPQSKLTFKGYGDGPYRTNYGNGDRSLVRDQIGAALWRSIRKAFSYPDNMIAPFYAWANAEAQGAGFPSQALFSTDGHPCSIIHDQTGFLGLYMLRTSAPNGDFLIDKNNPEHYLLQPQHAPIEQWLNFDSTGWAIASPKMKGYNDQDQIKDTFPEVLAPITRLTSWFNSVYTNSVDMRATYRDYVDLYSWIDYIVFCEATGSSDAFGNNCYLVSWNATETAGQWGVTAYDLDEILGIRFGSNAQTAMCDPVTMGFVSRDPGCYPFVFFNTYFSTEIAARYKYLRQSGTLSVDALLRSIAQTTNAISADDMAAEIAKWGTNDQASVAYILTWYARRLSWLDQQWGYSG